MGENELYKGVEGGEWYFQNPWFIPHHLFSIIKCWEFLFFSLQVLAPGPAVVIGSNQAPLKRPPP